VHFGEGKKSVDQLELGQLIAQAVKIDVSSKASSIAIIWLPSTT
jgi:kynurenine formamidase